SVMNSKSGNSGNPGNKEQGRYSAAEAHDVEKQPAEKPEHRVKEKVDEPDVIVTDKRRFTSEGEIIPIQNEPIEGGPGESGQDSQEDSASGQYYDSSEIELLQSKLKESEEKRVEAERQVRDFADRFRSAQAQLRAET